MASVTLSTLRSRARTRADMVSSTFVTDTELDQFLNASLDELYDVIVQKFDSDYFLSSTSGTTSGSTINLPSGFYKLVGIDMTLSGDPVSLRRFSFKERNRYRNADSANSLDSAPRYRLEGSTVRFYPTPATGTAYTLFYIPTRTQLVNTSDAVDYPNGWEEYAVIDAAIKMLQKEESDTTGLERAKMAMLQRIESAAENRNADEPARVTDLDSAYIGRDGFLWE